MASLGGWGPSLYLRRNVTTRLLQAAKREAERAQQE